MGKEKKSGLIPAMITDHAAPAEQRLALLRMVVNDPSPEAVAAAMALLERLAMANGESDYARKAKELSDLIEEMKQGPHRSGTFVGLVPQNGSVARHAFVILDDGTEAYAVVPDAELAVTLRRGDWVMIEGKGRALLRRAYLQMRRGDVTTLERRVDGDCVEVTVRGNDRSVLLASQDLLDQLGAGAVEPGASLIVNTRQGIAYSALPAQGGLSHYKFLVKEPVPDVRVDRDIGAPPGCIAELTEIIRTEMTHPTLRRDYRLRSCVMKLLSGVSGSGKTLALQAVWRCMYEVMSEVTGVPIAQLPPRVFRLRMSSVLSMWLGESDRNLDRFFAEIEKMADEPVLLNGREYKLPVLAILEEIDGLARARGGHTDGIYDRVLTTALQRLDPTREELKGKLILYVGTTNEPDQVDRAFMRRIGGTVEKFGRLNRRGFTAVLQKHLRGLPLASHNGATPDQLHRHMVAELTAWLFAPNSSDQAVVELAYAGSPTPDAKRRRDFLTGALVDRAVQQASTAAVQATLAGTDRPGLTQELLVRAFDEQILSVVDQLTEQNARAYLDLPDGMRVATVRRLTRPALPAHLFQRE